MNILYLHQYFKFPNEAGGTRSYDLAISFIKNRNNVEIISSTNDYKFKTSNRWVKFKKDGIIFHLLYLPIRNDFSYLHRIIIFLKFTWFATFKAISINSDCVLATSTPLTIGIPALLKKCFSRTPYIFEVRDVWPEAVIAIGAIKNRFLQKLLYGLEGLIYKKASFIVPLSVDMKTSIDNRYPELISKTVIVIPNISEIDRFHKEKDDYGLIKDSIGFTPRFSILYAGTFGKVNGIRYVIELAKLTIQVDSSIMFILMGEGAEKEDIKSLAVSCGVLNKNVFVLDPVSKCELPKWYAEASMGSSFVIDIPELWANSANKFFDTLAASKPILINHEGWQKKEIQMHNVGYVLPAKLNDGAVLEFVKYTQNRELIEQQQENAIILAKEKYSLEKAVESYEAIFQKLTTNKK